MVSRTLLLFICFAIKVNGQQLPEKGKWLVFGELGYSFNYTLSKLVSNTNPAAYLKNKQVATQGITYGFGVEYHRLRDFFGFKLKSVRMGYRFTIESETDSLKYRYGLFVAPYKNNLVVSVIYGRDIRWKRFYIKPALGIDYLPFPDHSPNSGFVFGNDIENLYVDMTGHYTGRLPLLANINLSIGYDFKIRKRAFSIEYNLSYSQGFSNLYTYSARFYTNTRTALFSATNKGSYLSQCVRLCLTLQKIPS